MNTCKTCKHWSQGSRWWYGYCGRMGKVPSQESIDPPERSAQFEIHFGPFIDVDQETAATASFSTGPDFGCIHHQPKEPA